MKELIINLKNVKVEDFDITYDLTSFFESYSDVNNSQVAAVAEIDYNLMRQYASGKKFPSEERVAKIEAAIHEIGRKLTRVRLHKRTEEVA